MCLIGVRQSKDGNQVAANLMIQDELYVELKEALQLKSKTFSISKLLKRD